MADALHDGPLQRILAARQDAQEALAGDQDALVSLPHDLETVALELRTLTKSMHEDLLDALPLRDALRRIADETGRRGRFAVTIDVDPEADGLHNALVRDAIRELLQNISRHAQASAVGIEVSVDRTRGVRLRVVDDGIGYNDPQALHKEAVGHVGLGRLRRTTEGLGGSFIISGSPGKGTVATVVYPVAALAAQRTLEDELRAERRWSSALLTALQDGLLVIRDGRIAQVNEAFLALTGWRRDQLIGSERPYPHWPPEEQAKLTRSSVAAEDRGMQSGAFRIMCADGRRLPVLASAARIADGVGGKVGMLVMIKDFSEPAREEERRRLEVELNTTIETTRRMTAMLRAAVRGREAMFAELNRAVGEHLGWDAAVVNLRGEQGDWQVAWTSSPELHASLGGASYSDADWEPLLDARFLRRGAYFIPSEAGVDGGGPWHVPTLTPVDAPDAWRAEDTLLIPMRRDSRTLVGLLSLDCPRSGRRPNDTELEMLCAVAENAALALSLATGIGSGLRPGGPGSGLSDDVRRHP